MEESRYQGIPQFVYGTAFKGDQTAILTSKALTHGFTGIDTAPVSSNYDENLTGEGVRQAIKKLQLKREQIFIQTKFTPYKEGKDPKCYPFDTTLDLETQVEQSITSSLKRLSIDTGTDATSPYLDNLTLHAPYPAFEDTLLVWRILEKYVQTGQISTLGISNVHLSTLTELYEKATVKPALVQNRFTPDTEQSLPPFTPQTRYDGPVRRFCREKRIVYQPWGILWGTCFPGTETLVKSELVEVVAGEIGVSKEMAVYLLVLGLEEGKVSVLNGTKSEERMKAAFDGLRRFENWVGGSGKAEMWMKYMVEFREILGDDEKL